jgi:membrane-associated protease RseP (regulator of RpoE activity)
MTGTMKKIFLITLATIFNITVCLSQGGNTTDGYIGIQTDISPDSQYLKITYCDPGYPADISGLKVGDRIYRVDDKKVGELTDPINQLLGASGTWVKLTISRFGKADFFDVNVPRISVPLNVNNYITEGTLSALIFKEWWNIYSTTLSLLYDDTKDMFKYKSYDFEFTSVQDPLQEKIFFNELGSQLNRMGMKRAQEKPDLLIIMSFYSGQKEQYVPPQQIISTKIKNTYNWYWGFIPVPITESTTKEGYTAVTYLTNISLKFLDANEIEGSKTPPVVWSGSISQTSGTQTYLTDKCSDFFACMLYQFPEVWQQNSKDYYLNHYSYTGLVYDKNDMQTIGEVIPESPANKIGIQKGDKILSINGCSLPDNYSYIVNHPYDFSIMINRSKPISRTGFRYLYLYANWNEARKSITNLDETSNLLTKPYKTDVTTLEFQIKRNGERMTFEIRPEDRVVILLFDN